METKSTNIMREEPCELLLQRDYCTRDGAWDDRTWSRGSRDCFEITDFFFGQKITDCNKGQFGFAYLEII